MVHRLPRTLLSGPLCRSPVAAGPPPVRVDDAEPVWPSLGRATGGHGHRGGRGGAVASPPADDRLDRLLAQVEELTRQNAAMLVEMGRLREEKVSLRREYSAWRSWAHQPYASGGVSSGPPLTFLLPPQFLPVPPSPDVAPPNDVHLSLSSLTRRMALDHEGPTFEHSPPREPLSAKRLCFGPPSGT